MKISSGKFFLYGNAIFVYSFLYAPIFILVLFSFNESKISTSWTNKLFNFKNLEEAFTHFEQGKFPKLSTSMEENKLRNAIEGLPENYSDTLEIQSVGEKHWIFFVQDKKYDIRQEQEERKEKKDDVWVVVEVLETLSIYRTSDFTLKWYKELFNNKKILQAIQKSVLLAVISTFIATIIGTLVAFGMQRYSFPGKKIFDAVLHLPMIIPDIVLAVAFLSFYTLLQFMLDKISVPFSLGLTTMIIAHVTFNITFVAVVVRARLAGFNYNLEKAAMDLGATPRQTFWHVTLPLIFPGIIAGSLLAFTLSWDDYIIASLTSGSGSTTLPICVYTMAKHGVTPEINAVSTVTLFFTLTLSFMATRLQKDV